MNGILSLWFWFMQIITGAVAGGKRRMICVSLHVEVELSMPQEYPISLTWRGVGQYG